MFENQADSAFLLRREGIRLETTDGRTFAPAPVGEVFENLRFSQAPTALGVPFLVFPAFMIHDRIAEQNNAFLSDFRDKAFRDMRLYNNPSSYNCLVFFPDDRRRSSGAARLPTAGYRSKWNAKQPLRSAG